MRRNAICIGINYAGTDYALSGCINDADDWASYLNGLGFNVGMLVEAQATKALITSSMLVMASSLEAGDVGVITYSGHGTWVPDLNGDEPDRKDEAFCPIDMGDDGANLLIDDEINMILSTRAHGSRIVLITDSCHSGTVFRFFSPKGTAARKVRYLPPAHFAKSSPMIAAVNRLGPEGVKPSDTAVPGVLHYSGCKDREYSYDAEFGSRANGAFTYYAMRAAKNLKDGATYGDWYKAIHRQLPSDEYPQSPRFNATRPERDLPLFT